MTSLLNTGVTRIRSCELAVVPGHWPYAEASAAEIDSYWRGATARNPASFNGTVHVLRQNSIVLDREAGKFAAQDTNTTARPLPEIRRSDTAAVSSS